MDKLNRIIEWVHVTLIFALPVPFFFAVGELTQEGGAVVLYAKCLLIAVPIVVTSIAVRRVETLTGYIAVCAVMLIVLGIVIFTRQEWSVGDIVYATGMTLETIIIVGKRFSDRLRQIRLEKNNDPFAPRQDSFFDRPALALVWYFVIMYVLGLLFNSKSVCDMAFFSAIAYLFLSLVYTFFGTTKEYLNLNKRTKGIPKKRLYGISGGMIFIYALIVAAAIIPSIFFMNARRYTDIREWLSGTEPAPYEITGPSGFQDSVSVESPGLIEQLDEGLEPPPEPSKLWAVLFWTLGAVFSVVVIYAVVMAIRQIFNDFRRGLDENGDKVEELEDETAYKDEILSLVRRRGDDSEAARIRRKYKKTIKKHTKEQPAPYGTPTELETDAGLLEDEDMRELHKLYENVRYNKQG